MPHSDKIHSQLDKIYSQFHRTGYRKFDPVSLVHRYKDPIDQEVVGLLAASLAYGNAQTIISNVQSLLEKLSERPSRQLNQKYLKGKFNGFRHRFTTGEDIEILLNWIGTAIDSNGSLGNLFTGTERHPPKTGLSQFIDKLSSQPLPKHLVPIAHQRSRNLKYLISNPTDGSACKRMNMYLRWMVRKADGIDLGLWTQLTPAQLMLPVDTHILKAIRYFGWTRSKQATWKVVESATAELRTYCPEDPIRYDFSLCQLSMQKKWDLD